MKERRREVHNRLEHAIQKFQKRDRLPDNKTINIQSHIYYNNIPFNIGHQIIQNDEL